MGIIRFMNKLSMSKGTKLQDFLLINHLKRVFHLK
jgi:hypothetical protein